MEHDLKPSIPKVGEPKLDKVLVVISPDLVAPGAPRESTLINRAIALAKVTGCELELFHVCHESSLSPSFFQHGDDFRRELDRHLERNATLMAELVVRLNAEGVSISHDTRRDTPRTDAILRKIRDSQPDLVMKQSQEYDYVVGLIANTDWDLIRQSPAHLWFVTEGGSNKIDRFITAVGANADSSEMIAPADDGVFRMASVIADRFAAENFPVHAYQVPMGIAAYAAYAPEFGGAGYSQVAPISLEEKRRDVARKHGQSIEAFAEYFHLDPQRVQLRQGDPAVVLPEVADSLNANLIVMAARNLSAWQRFRQPVTAEPVLADAPCDVLFVKDSDDLSVPYDLEKIIAAPGQVFATPMKLAETLEISREMRLRILQIWEQDIRGQMAVENEGGSVAKPKSHLLDDIRKARASAELAH